MATWVKTAGQRLAELLESQHSNGVQGHDLKRLHRIANGMSCEPERAAITDFGDGDADFVHKMYSAHGT